MFSKISFPSAAPQLRLVGILAVAGLAACTPKTGPGQFNDPYEAQNRRAHNFNVQLDSAVIKPASQVYGHVVPSPVRAGVSNFASNLSVPRYILNDLLQAKLGAAGQNTLRFAFNTIFGIGGIFDPAGALGLPAASNDFGETLYVWGAREGAYLDVPFLGPSTERDLAGTVVDAITDPVSAALPADANGYPLAVRLTARLGDRYKYNDLIDSILHQSADSYAQQRLIYLEKRHHDLGIKSTAAPIDPYEDPYAN